ncbi:hypothetical protein YC2023_090037 [Brassica napus]
MVMQKSVVEDVRVDTMVVEVAATRKVEVVVDTVGVGYGYGEVTVVLFQQNVSMKVKQKTNPLYTKAQVAWRIKKCQMEKN